MKEMMHHALKVRITRRQRELLYMYYYENKSMPKIADQLGIAKQNVSKTIKRAITNIQKDQEIQKIIS